MPGRLGRRTAGRRRRPVRPDPRGRCRGDADLGRCPDRAGARRRAPRSALHTRVVLGARAELSAAPQPVVVCAGSRVDVTLSIDLDPTATVRWREVLVLGRSDESAGAVSVDWDVRRGGRPLLRQRLDLTGPETWAGLLRGHRVLATELHAGPQRARAGPSSGPTGPWSCGSTTTASCSRCSPTTPPGQLSELARLSASSGLAPREPVPVGAARRGALRSRFRPWPSANRELTIYARRIVRPAGEHGGAVRRPGRPDRAGARRGPGHGRSPATGRRPPGAGRLRPDARPGRQRTSTSTSRVAPSGRASRRPRRRQRPAASRPSSTCRSTASRPRSTWPRWRPSRRPPRDQAVVDVAFWGGAIPGNLDDLRGAPRGRCRRLQVLPAAVRRRRVPAARRRAAARRDDPDRVVRGAADRPRRGRRADRPGRRTRSGRPIAASWPRGRRPPRSPPSTICSRRPARPVAGPTSCTCRPRPRCPRWWRPRPKVCR